MQKRNLIVRIVAIILCALMILSVVSVAIYVFAAEVNSETALPATGSSDSKLIIIVSVVAVLVIVGCIVFPKFAKKK